MVQGPVDREYEKDGVRHRVFELRAETIGKLDRTEGQEPATGTEDYDRVTASIGSPASGLPIFVSPRRCWDPRGEWRSVGPEGKRGRPWPQFGLMAGI